MSPGTLNDDVITEILLRLPSKSVLRFRAVCKNWRRITTCSSFVAAYSRHRPLEFMVYTEIYETSSSSMNALAAVPLAGDHGDGNGYRRLLHHHTFLKLFGSCDGLLLFSQARESLLIFNPATRQWARLPRLTPEPCASVVPGGFYFHRPSGEHRVLCFGLEMPPNPLSLLYAGDAVSVNYILSIGGAAEPRRLGPFNEDDLGDHNPYSRGVAVGGSLYWPRVGGSGKMLAFDTVSETFRQISLPKNVRSNVLDLFDMHGTLGGSGVARCRGTWLDVWALEDDDGERWSHRFCIKLPPPGEHFLSVAQAVAWLEGDVLVVFAFGWVVVFEMKKKRIVRKVYHGDYCKTIRYVHRESLVPAVVNDQPCPVGEPVDTFYPGKETKLIQFSSSANEGLLGQGLNLLQLTLGKMWLAKKISAICDKLWQKLE